MRRFRLYSWQLPKEDYVNTSAPSGIRMHGIYDFALIGDLRLAFGRSFTTSLLISNQVANNALFEDPRVLAASVDSYEDAFVDYVQDGHVKERLKLALAFLLTINRVPLIYMGNEYGRKTTLPGDLFLPGNDAAFRDWFAGVVRIRRDHAAALARGSHAWLTNHADFLSYGRVSGGIAAGAGVIVDPRFSAEPEILALYRCHPHLGPVLPAVGYSAAERDALARTIERSDAEVVISGSPIDLAAVLGLAKPVVRARYALADPERPGLADLVDGFLASAGLGAR